MKYVPAYSFIVQEQHFDILRNYNIKEDVKGLYGLSEKEGDVWFTGDIEFLKRYEHPGVIVDFRAEVFDDCFIRAYNSSAMETNRIVIADPFNSYRHVCTYLGKIRNHLTLSEVKERCPEIQAVIYETDNSCYSVNLEYSDHFG